MRQLEEDERTGVGGDASLLPVGEDEHDEQRELVREHVAEGPPRQAPDVAHRRVVQVEMRTDAHAGPSQGGQQHERHEDDPRRGPEAEGEQQHTIAAHLLE